MLSRLRLSPTRHSSGRSRSEEEEEEEEEKEEEEEGRRKRRKRRWPPGSHMMVMEVEDTVFFSLSFFLNQFRLFF